MIQHRRSMAIVASVVSLLGISAVAVVSPALASDPVRDLSISSGSGRFDIGLSDETDDDTRIELSNDRDSLDLGVYEQPEPETDVQLYRTEDGALGVDIDRRQRPPEEKFRFSIPF